MRAKNKKNLGIHFGLLFAEIICISAFVVELSRALSGNELSWAYVFEWPLFAAYAIYMWHKLLHEDQNSSRSDDTPDLETEASRARYNAYLRSLHDSDHGDATR